MTALDLATLQAWLQHRVTAGPWQPGDIGGGPDATRIVAASPMLSAEDRIGIYARSYVQRLVECLRVEFPVLRALIGDQVFDLFVGGYLSAHPPTSYSLYDLGAGFADYLAATCPNPHPGRGTPEALPASLARLERALAEAERAAGVENDSPTHHPFDVVGLLRQPDARLASPPSVKLLCLDFDFAPTLAELHAGRRPPLPTPRECFVAVARARYRVRTHTLEPWQYAWLMALGDNDGRVTAACHAVAAGTNREASAVLGQLLIWLPLAIEAGFIAPYAHRLPSKS